MRTAVTNHLGAATRVSVDHRIECERLTLRPVSLSDYEHFFGLITDPVVMRFIGLEAGRIPSANEVKAHVQRAVAAWRTRGYGRWSAFDRETGDFVGFSGFRCEDGTPELISIVHERYWGNGYATEAAAAVISYGFEQLGFDEVCAYVRPENERARVLLDKLGAEYIGIVDFHGVEGAAYTIRPDNI